MSLLIPSANQSPVFAQVRGREEIFSVTGNKFKCRDRLRDRAECFKYGVNRPEVRGEAVPEVVRGIWSESRHVTFLRQ